MCNWQALSVLEKLLIVVDVFIILSILFVSWVYTLAKTCQIVCYKYAVYFNLVILQKDLKIKQTLNCISCNWCSSL